MNGEYITRREESLLALLLEIVIDHCTDPKSKLDSWGIPSHTHAMCVLPKMGFIRIEDDDEDRIRATVSPKGEIARRDNAGRSAVEWWI
jgi:hypothetical protein